MWHLSDELPDEPDFDDLPEIEDRDLLECEECGCRWDGGYIPATRIDPPDYLRPDCPHCDALGPQHLMRFGPEEDCELCATFAARHGAEA